MSDQVVNIPASRLEEILGAPVRIAEIEAAEMVRRGDVAGASRHLQAAVQQQAQQRSQIAATQPAAPSPVAQPSNAAAPTASAGAPLAAPGTPPPHAVPIPTEQLANENLGQFYIRRGSALRQAAQVAGDGQLDLSRPMGLRRR